MTPRVKRVTVYLEPEIYRALRLKAATINRSASELVNEALRAALREDQEDIAAFTDRATEPVLSYEELLNDLKTHGKL